MILPYCRGKFSQCARCPFARTVVEYSIKLRYSFVGEFNSEESFWVNTLMIIILWSCCFHRQQDQNNHQCGHRQLLLPCRLILMGSTSDRLAAAGVVYLHNCWPCVDTSDWQRFRGGYMKIIDVWTFEDISGRVVYFSAPMVRGE